jgi:hypothetical protein
VFRRRKRVRALTEAEAYHRCHGGREADVKVVTLPPRRPRYQLKVSGEDLRSAFEQRLSRREPDEQGDVAGLS